MRTNEKGTNEIRTNQSELKSDDKSVILFAIFAITLHIIAVDGTNQPEILTNTFYFKNKFLFYH